MKYRPEIDGLRAIAVLSVILMHAKLLLWGTDWFAGGFVGVDVFFVISGYLITQIILSELQQTQRFNFWHFYERRARRILPVLFVVMLVSLSFAWHILLPTAFAQFAKSLLSALGFVSNFFFYEAATEYGAPDAYLMPFLHSWTLSIEEQFYLLFPILILGFRRICPKQLLGLFITLLLASVIYAEWLSHRNAALNFYFSFSRFWELLAGALLAYVQVHYGRLAHKPYHPFLTALGVAMIGYAVVTFDLVFDGTMQHPGIMTLIPVIGTMLVIAFTAPENRVGRALSMAPLRGIGLVSYSAYLWHFPIFAFARIQGEFNAPSIKLALIALTFALSILSYRLIETPFRNKAIIPLRTLIISLTTCAALIAGSAAYIIASDGMESRFESANGYIQYEPDNEKLWHQSWSIIDSRQDQPFAADKIRVLIVGNSHSKDLFNALHLNPQIYGEYDFKIHRIQVSCFDPDNADNRKVAEAFFNEPDYQQSQIILVSSRYMQEAKCRGLPDNAKRSPSTAGFPALIERVSRDGKPIILFGNAVEFEAEEEAEQTLNDELVKQLKDDGRFQETLLSKDKAEAFMRYAAEEHFKHLSARPQPINDAVRAIAAQYDVPYVDKYTAACDFEQQQCFSFTPEGNKAYFDAYHVTLEGAKIIGQRFAEQGLVEVLRQAAITP